MPSSIQVMVDMRPALKTVLAIGRVGYRAAAAEETNTSSERTKDASILAKQRGSVNVLPVAGEPEDPRNERPSGSLLAKFR